MELKKYILLNYLICLIGFLAEFIFTHSLNPKDQSVYIFLIAWGSCPLITLLLFLRKTPRVLYSMKKTLIQTSVVVGFGILYKINSIYIHPDPRGAVALATVPIIQIIAALFLGVIIKLMTQKHFSSQIENEDQQSEENEKNE